MKEQIQKYWNPNVESFDEKYNNEDKGKWMEYFRNLMGAAGGQKVLNIGTETSFLAVMAAELAFDVTGIDLAEQMSFGSESFDYIVTSCLLWTLEEPDTALKEWYRVLKKGGQLLSFIRLTDEMKICISKEYYSSEVYDTLASKHSSGAELIEYCQACGYTKVDLVKLPGIAYDSEVYGEWYVLRAIKEQYDQNHAIEAISDFWNRRSSTYDKDHELTSLDFWKRILVQLVGEDKSAKIIDLATGTGMIANLLGEIGYTNVTGMDISEGMMEIARKHALERNTGVHFMYGNALNLPLEDNSVDVLISCRLLWTLVEPEKALREWMRVVKTGGVVIALHEMEEQYTEVEKEQVWRHFLYGKNADPYIELHNATKTEYVQWFKQSGLKDARIIHMEGCQTLENGKSNWYALVGTKENKL